MHRSSTVRTACGQDYVKDLSRLGRSLSRTVLVDNAPFSGLLQPCNVLPTRAFHGEASDRCRHLRLARLEGVDPEKLCLHSYRPAVDSMTPFACSPVFLRVLTLPAYCSAVLSNDNRFGILSQTCLSK